MFSKAFAVITNVIGQGVEKYLPYEAPEESYSCLSGKTIWEVRKAKRKVCFQRVKYIVIMTGPNRTMEKS